MKLQHGILVALSVMVIGACGGSTNSTYSSGVDKAKAGSAMTTDEQTKFCSSALSNYASAINKESMCKITAFLLSSTVALQDTQATDATLQAACKQAYDGCISDPKSASTEPSATDMTECITQVAACSATTAEIEACVNDYTIEVNKVIAAIPSCSSMSLTSLSMPGLQSAEPASCKALATKCPALVAGIKQG